VTPDYTIPARFIPTDGGTLDYASGTDRITLPVLPTDGAMSINRNGAPMLGAPKNFANATATMTAQPVTSVEFYNQSLDHYFISSLAPDIDALDSGRLSGWTRTGSTFGVYPSQAAGGASVTPVCRIIIPPPFGDSHFFGRSVQECADTLTKFPFMSEETPDAFFVTLPTAGVCPDGTVPVYRVFSNRADANHRYMIDRALRDQMVAMGWLAEGDGPDLVVMCAPPAPAIAG
jgi:serine protease